MFDYAHEWHRKLQVTGWWHSFQLPDGTVIEGVNSLDSQKTRLSRFAIPQVLTGRRVLDIGAWDGWFSFEMERRGAEVVAVDCWENPRFLEMREVLGSRVEYRHMDVYELTPDRIGKFDYVLFLGVLYHLKHPLLALERVCALTEDLAAVESFVLRERHLPGVDGEQRPLMEFYEGDEFGGQIDNWVGPSLSCLLAFCRTAGFARADLCGVHDYGAAVACRRRWDSPPPDAVGGPELICAVNNRNYGINFRSDSDEYVHCRFAWPVSDLTRGDVNPDVGGYGVQPVYLGRVQGDFWQVIFKLPPGLPPGWHEVRIRAARSHWSNVVRIAVDVTASAERLAVRGLCDGVSSQPGQTELAAGGHLSLWIEGLPPNADRNNVRILIGKIFQLTSDVAGADPLGIRQVNVKLTKPLCPGLYELTVYCGGAESPPVSLTVAP